jgi:hypothetical protein
LKPVVLASNLSAGQFIVQQLMGGPAIVRKIISFRKRERVNGELDIKK